ncbi:MAG: DUF1073 domain-containing protein [Leptospiraceae bacterium]|nr:DUF1073 domain-containing protein [Leptospiraceae bacterium]MCK6380846.1 DUF1073 domain-containing protein [Leptospiraceae bacterium]
MSKQKLQTRYDSLVDVNTGMGTNTDKLTHLRPRATYLSSEECRSWYKSNGFIQNIVDAPAEDSVREWITIKTNKDELNISRIIENRLTELNVKNKLKNLIRFSRLYPEGGFLFYGVNSPIPQTSLNLKETLPDSIYRISYLNVFGPDRVTITERKQSPLEAEYHKPEIRIDGYPLHSSRFSWLCPFYMPEEQTGISIIETIMHAIIAQHTAVHSTTTMLYETGSKIFKSPKVETLPPKEMAEFVRKIRSVMSSQSTMAIAGDEEIKRLETNLGGQGIKDLLEFIFDNLSGLARIPKSRLMGQAQGAIASGQYDLRSYYDDIARDQENDLRPILEKIIGLIVREQDGEIYKTLGGNVNSLDWEFTFNPLWQLSEKEESEIELNQARADDIYLTRGVVGPNDVRTKRFQEFEEFPAVEGNTEFGNLFPVPETPPENTATPVENQPGKTDVSLRNS